MSPQFSGMCASCAMIVLALSRASSYGRPAGWVLGLASALLSGALHGCFNRLVLGLNVISRACSKWGRNVVIGGDGEEQG